MFLIEASESASISDEAEDNDGLGEQARSALLQDATIHFESLRKDPGGHNMQPSDWEEKHVVQLESQGIHKKFSRANPNWQDVQVMLSVQELHPEGHSNKYK